MYVCFISYPNDSSAFTLNQEFNGIKKVLQLNCKTQLMERDALNQQHVTQCYAIALIKSRRSLLVVGKTTG